MGIGDNLNTRWLTDKELLILHRNSLDQLVIEIRDLAHGTSKRVPPVLDLTTSPATPFVGIPPESTIKLSSDRRFARIWWFGSFRCVSIFDAANKKNMILRDIPRLGEFYQPHPHVPQQGKPQGFLDASHWIYCYDKYWTTPILYVVGDDNGAMSEIQAFDVPINMASNNNKCYQLGLTAKGNLLESVRPESWSTATKTAVVLEYVPGTSSPLHIYPVNLPIPKNAAAEFSIPPALSPDGSKIAWLLPYSDGHTDSKFTDFLRRHHVLPPRPDHAVWTSDCYGRNIHLVSILAASHTQVSELDWTPDGRYITFKQEIIASATQMKVDVMLHKIQVAP